MMRCHTNLGRDICESVSALVSAEDFGEVGEVILESREVSIEVMPIGLGMAPDKMENDKVKLRMVGGRDPGGGGILPSRLSGDAESVRHFARARGG